MERGDSGPPPPGDQPAPFPAVGTVSCMLRTLKPCLRGFHFFAQDTLALAIFLAAGAQHIDHPHEVLVLGFQSLNFFEILRLANIITGDLG